MEKLRRHIRRSPNDRHIAVVVANSRVLNRLRQGWLILFRFLDGRPKLLGRAALDGEPAGGWSRDDIPNDVAVHVGKSETASLIFEGEPLVIDPHQVQDGGIEVVNVDGVAGDVVPEVVGFAE